MSIKKAIEKLDEQISVFKGSSLKDTEVKISYYCLRQILLALDDEPKDIIVNGQSLGTIVKEFRHFRKDIERRVGELEEDIETLNLAHSDYTEIHKHKEVVHDEGKLEDCYNCGCHRATHPIPTCKEFVPYPEVKEEKPKTDKDILLPKYSKRNAEIVVECYYAGLKEKFSDNELRQIMMPVLQKHLNELVNADTIQIKRGVAEDFYRTYKTLGIGSSTNRMWEAIKTALNK